MVLTEKGFIRPTYDELLGRQERRAKELFGEDIDTSGESILGKFIRINVEDLAECYELLEELYYARFPNTARGQSLDRLCTFAGMVRDPATAAKIRVRFHGVAGAVVPMAFLIDGDGQTFYVADDYAIGPDGAVEAKAVCTAAGAAGNIALGTPMGIKNPAADISSVELLEILSYGTEREKDAALRLRFGKSVAGMGSSTSDAISGAVSRVPLVDGVTVIENDTDQAVDGRPPHTFECYVLAPESQDQMVAEAIFSKKPLGIRAIGDVGMQVLDEGNKPHTVCFSRMDKKEIYIAVVVLVNQFFEASGADQIKDSLAGYVNNLANGEAVYLSSLYGHIHEIHGVLNVQGLQLSDDGTDYRPEDVFVAEHEIARVSPEHISVEVAG